MTFLQAALPGTQDAIGALDVPAALAFAYGVIRLFMADGRQERETRREEASAAQQVASAMDEQARALTTSHALVDRLIDRGRPE